jgi:uncharacterized protein (DUF885 family)
MAASAGTKARFWGPAILLLAITAPLLPITAEGDSASNREARLRLASQAATPPASGSFEEFAADFWAWRARYQPFTADDIPRIEHPFGSRNWSAASITKQRESLGQLENRWKAFDPRAWPVPRQVDHRLMGSALARVRWELDINRRWERDPTFYLDQTLGALADALLAPPPFDGPRSREIMARMDEIPAILETAKANLHSAAPFAKLASESLKNIRSQLQTVGREVGPMLSSGSQGRTAKWLELAKDFESSTEKATTALEAYRAWLEKGLPSMPSETAVGRDAYVFFLKNVALLPYSPEQLLAMSRQEWDRAVAFEQYEKNRNRALPELKLMSSAEEQAHRTAWDELAIIHLLIDKGILSVPPGMGHYTVRPVPGYLQALADFAELDDFTSPTRWKENGVRWIYPPSPKLGYFWLATAKDTRPILIHEGVPGHYFQLALSWSHEDPIRRHYYDSGANEGLGFYAEEMMLQAGLFDDSPRTREIIYNFMRLRALRVAVDVKLALGQFALEQAAEYLARTVPMDAATARGEAASFATGPGQAISYQIGKIQIVRFLTDARLAQGDKFNLRAFHDFLWKNGNVPIALQRWEYLGLDDDVPQLSAVQP